MTYRELYEKATRQLEHNEITLGEYEKMIKPLDRPIGTCKDCNNREDCFIDIDDDFYCKEYKKRGSEK